MGDGLVIAVKSYTYKFVIRIASLEGVPLMSVYPSNLRFSALLHANN
ncbi:hypothetical protein ALTERO38_60320 [Alteromonas sp. 38]|nr:hypothetical protein ALTER154_40473 [Alteromonas sp. 154]VXC17773.1 hypothetical protein ALTERO38_60320 [Alteromonas sp. 38]